MCDYVSGDGELMDRDLFVDASVKTAPHKLERSKTKGMAHCTSCRKDVKPSYEYSWCGTEPFAFCPHDPHAPSNKKKLAKKSKKRHSKTSQ